MPPENKEFPVNGELNSLQDFKDFLSKSHPDWTESQLESILTKIRLVNLLDFYQKAVKIHPDLQVLADELIPELSANRENSADPNYPLSDSSIQTE